MIEILLQVFGEIFGSILYIIANHDWDFVDKNQMLFCHLCSSHAKKNYETLKSSTYFFHQSRTTLISGHSSRIRVTSA